MREDLAGEVAEVVALLHETVDDLEHGPAVVDGDGVGQFELDVALRGTYERGDGVLPYLSTSEHRALIEQGERVPHGSLRLPGQGFGGRTGQHQPLLLGHPLEVVR